MALFKLNLNNQTLIIIFTSIIWVMNFRFSFKNIYAHMDQGSFLSLQLDPLLFLIKNIACILYFLAFFIETKKVNQSADIESKNIIVTKKISENLIMLNSIEHKTKKNIGQIKEIALSNMLMDSKKKFFFILKVILLIIFIYISEELYFLLINNHVLDRIMCQIRNFIILISILILSLIFFGKKIDKTQIKNYFVYQKHEVIPLIIIFVLSLTIIMVNVLSINRFFKVYGGLNILYYSIIFFLMGIEVTIIKYLVDKLYINKFLILGIKGILGTIVFTVINITVNKDEFYLFFDNLLSYEYMYQPEEFDLVNKIFYVLTLWILQYLKIVVINRFSEIFLLSTLMITDIIYFPLYCIERFAIQQFKISTVISFIINVSVGIINTIMMLIINEILEVNICGLNKYLRRNIINRNIVDLKDTRDTIMSCESATEED